MVAEGAKPPHSNNVNGAGAGKAAAGAGGGGLAAWWQRVTSKQTQQEIHRAVNSVKQKAQTIKWSMPVDVKVDFLRPTFETVRESLLNVWVQLPPPVQQAAPYVGAAVGSSLVVFAIQQRRLNHQKQQNNDLTLQVKTLKKEKEDLLKRINLLKARSGSPRSEVEARMAAAVAEATNAAAAAADAAARAATACIIQQRPPLNNTNSRHVAVPSLPQ